MLSFKENQETIAWHLEDFCRTVEYRKTEDENISIGQIAKSYVENQISMEDAMTKYFNFLKDQDKKNERLLRVIKRVKGNTFYKYLMFIIEESEGIKGLATIVNEPTGSFQKEKHGRQIDGIWVNQWGVGDSGDSWEGTVCVKLRENKYLKFSYSM